MNSNNTPIVDRDSGIHKLLPGLYIQRHMGAFKMYTVSKKSHKAFLLFSTYKANGHIGIYPPQTVNGLEVFKHKIQIK